MPFLPEQEHRLGEDCRTGQAPGPMTCGELLPVVHTGIWPKRTAIELVLSFPFPLCSWSSRPPRKEADPGAPKPPFPEGTESQSHRNGAHCWSTLEKVTSYWTSVSPKLWGSPARSPELFPFSLSDERSNASFLSVT